MRLLRLLAMTVALFVLVGVAAPALASAAPAPDQPPAAAPIAGQLRGDITLHDPALAKGPGAREWFVYSSGDPGKDGGTVQIRKSVDDGRTWAYLGTVWPTIPKWITDIVPDADTMWAPEIIRHGSTYYLYYAVSTLGHNDSVIALATNTTLDPKAPGYRWVDQGKVVRSLPASDFNAIDPTSSRTPRERRGWCSAPTGAGSRWCSCSGRRASAPPTPPARTCSTARSR